MHLPIRARVAVAVATAMMLLLAALGLISFRAMAAALLDELDTGLRFRAVAAARDTQVVPPADPRLQEPTESFEQVLASDGTVLRASPGFSAAVLSAPRVAGLREPLLTWVDLPDVVGRTRVLAVPQGQEIVVVGASGQDRADALAVLRGLLLVGGVAALVLSSLVGWGVAGLALRPVDRMRAQADAITASGLDRRLSEPHTRDELARLATTLNQMLDRLAESVSRERGFLERAGHELRTPLAALRAEVDLALRRERSPEELTAALRSVSIETDRLARLADDLLVLARTRSGRLVVRRQPLPLRDALETAVARVAARASELGVEVVVAAQDTVAFIDPERLRQALLNLIDNALRHAPAGSTIDVVGGLTDGSVCVSVTDAGPGFAADQVTGQDGLGLAIATAVARAHGGQLRIGRGPEGGAEVVLTLGPPPS